MEAVVSVHGDVATHEIGEFAASVSAGESEQQDRRIAVFEYLVGPASASFPLRLDDEFDVVGQ